MSKNCITDGVGRYPLIPVLINHLFNILANTKSTMDVVALISGGKDSCFNIMHCINHGHRIVALANIKPHIQGEMDSYMYQSVGNEAIEIISKAIDIPLYQIETQGIAKVKDLFYVQTENDEIEDLYQILKMVKNKHPSIRGVSSGAIWSNYQRLRVENICSRLGIISLSYLWQFDQGALLRNMIESGLDAITVKIGSLGLTPEKHLGKHLYALEPELIRLGKDCGLNVCGEGGEYETITLNAPFFKQRVIIDKFETVIASKDPYSPVAFIKIIKLHLEDKVSGEFPKITTPNLLKNPFLELDGKSELLLNRSVKCVTDFVAKYSMENIKIFFGEKYFCLSAIAFSDTTDIEKGVKTIFQQIETELTNYKLNFSQFINTNLLLSNINNFTLINNIYSKYFQLKPPSRVCIQTIQDPNTLLRLELIGVLEEQSSYCMHIQSYSYWAPANIGPYAQCYTVNQWVFIAGQIGLIPSEMELTEINIQPQLSLEHCQTVLAANSSDVTCYLTGSCYGTNRNILEQSHHIFDTLYGGEVAHHMGYIIIPALPKNAVCEWHLTAVTNGTFHTFKKQTFQIESETLKSDVTIFSSANDAAFTIHFCSQKEINEFQFETLEKEIPFVLQEMKSKIDFSSNNLAVIRVWTVLTHSNIDVMLSGWLQKVWLEHMCTKQVNVCVYQTEGILYKLPCLLIMQVLILP